MGVVCDSDGRCVMSDEPITGFLRPTGRTGQLVLDVEDFPEESWVHDAFTDDGKAAVEIHHQGARDRFLETAAENQELRDQVANGDLTLHDLADAHDEIRRLTSLGRQHGILSGDAVLDAERAKNELRRRRCIELDSKPCKNTDCYMGKLPVDDNLSAKPCPECNS